MRTESIFFAKNYSEVSVILIGLKIRKSMESCFEWKARKRITVKPHFSSEIVRKMIVGPPVQEAVILWILEVDATITISTTHAVQEKA